MLWRLLADITVLAHLVFIVFAVAGGFLVLRHPRWAWLHLPAIAWVVWLEFTATACPLTVVENRLRVLAGDAGYSGGFIEHHLLPVIYPAGLTPTWQAVMGSVVLAIAIVTYGVALRRRWVTGAPTRSAVRPPQALAAEDPR